MELASLPIAVVAILVRRLMDVLQRPQTVERVVVPSGRFTYAIIPLCLLYIYRYIHRGKVCNIVKDCSCRIRGIKGRLRDCRFAKYYRRSDPWVVIKGRCMSGPQLDSKRTTRPRLQETTRHLCPPKLRHSLGSTGQTPMTQNFLQQSERAQSEPAREIRAPSTPTTDAQDTKDTQDEGVPNSSNDSNEYTTIDLTADCKSNESASMKLDSETQSEAVFPCTYSPVLGSQQMTIGNAIVSDNPSAKELRDYYRNARFEPSYINIETPRTSSTSFMNKMFYRSKSNGSRFLGKKCHHKRKRKFEHTGSIPAALNLEKKTTRSGHFYGYRA